MSDLALGWRLFALTLTLVVAGWGTLALHYRGPRLGTLRHAVIAAWLGLAAIALVATAAARTGHALWPAPVIFMLAWLGLAVWWQTVRPRQDRDWAADVARLLDARIDGNIATLHNVRNFEWRTREDFDARWETRRYDLSMLRSADMVLSYWTGPAIAHTLVSFGFADGRFVVFSVEVRRTRGQRFSALGGFFRQSEQVLVAADERDIVRTRSNARGEQVHLFRVALAATDLRALFAAYVHEAQKLQRRPRFYNTLWSNCTTIVYDMIKRIVPGVPWDYRLLLSGYLPEYLHEIGALDRRQSVAELRARGHINARALASDIDGHSSPTFSQAIRENVPAPPQVNSQP